METHVSSVLQALVSQGPIGWAAYIAAVLLIAVVLDRGLEAIQLIMALRTVRRGKAKPGTVAGRLAACIEDCLGHTAASGATPVIDQEKLKSAMERRLPTVYERWGAKADETLRHLIELPPFAGLGMTMLLIACGLSASNALGDLVVLPSFCGIAVSFGTALINWGRQRFNLVRRLASATLPHRSQRSVVLRAHSVVPVLFFIALSDFLLSQRKPPGHQNSGTSPASISLPASGWGRAPVFLELYAFPDSPFELGGSPLSENRGERLGQIQRLVRNRTIHCGGSPRDIRIRVLSSPRVEQGDILPLKRDIERAVHGALGQRVSVAFSEDLLPQATTRPAGGGAES